MTPQIYARMSNAICFAVLASLIIPPLALAQTVSVNKCCWINAKTGKPYPSSRLVPVGMRGTDFEADPNHYHYSSTEGEFGGTNWVRDSEGSWINAKTGKKFPCDRLVPVGMSGTDFEADPNHYHYSSTEGEFGGTNWVRVPCPPPGTAAGTAPPSHASVNTAGQPIVEINPPTPVPRFELGIGYNYIHAPDEDVKDLHGFNASFFYNVNGWLSFGGEFMGGFGSESFRQFSTDVDTSLDRYVYVFGPRVSLRPTPAFTIFAQALVGGDHDSSDTTFTTHFAPNIRAASTSSSFSSSADCWAFDFGIGADWQFARHWSWRIAEASYLATTFSSATSDHWQNNWRISTGLVYHFGGPPATTTTRSDYSKESPVTAK
jgi:hypothetical protein